MGKSYPRVLLPVDVLAPPGVVGAGGIGLQTAERIKIRYWDQVSFVILLILATVAVIRGTKGSRIRVSLTFPDAPLAATPFR